MLGSLLFEHNVDARINDELSTPFSCPWLDPDVVGHHPALPDVDSRIRVNILLELFLMGGFSGGIVPRRDRRCDLDENEERVNLRSLV